jgi:hypothetical protein
VNGHVVVRGWSNASASDPLAEIVKIDDTNVKVTFENCDIVGKLRAKPRSYSASHSYSGLSEILFRDCLKPVAPADLILTAQASDGGSKYHVKYQDCAGVPNISIGGASDGSINKVPGTLRVYGMAGALSGFVTQTTKQVTFPVAVRVKSVQARTGFYAQGPATLKVFKDAGKTLQAGTTANIANGDTFKLFDCGVSPATCLFGTDFWLECAVPGSGYVSGYWLVEYDALDLVE